MKVAGSFNSFFLFTNDGRAAVLDSSTNMVVQTGAENALTALIKWEAVQQQPSQTLLDLAAGALTDLDIVIVAGGDRAYTIPKAAQAEAKRGLEWRAKHNRGGTPVGVNSARTLSRGGQIGIRKIRHIAKYFPRHEIDKKGKGWSPGQEGYPSRGRIAWALWGGDPAWRWARQIVERENKRKKNGVRADGYSGMLESEYDIFGGNNEDVKRFWDAAQFNDDSTCEFTVRVNLETGAIDRLYMVEPAGEVFIWDGAGWDDLGHVSHDFETYDRSLDDPYDDAPRTHMPIDPQSAMKVSAFLQENPFSSVGVSLIEPDEAMLMADAADEIDWEIVDRAAVTAAGEEGLSAPKDSTPGVYTPEERSENASSQVRDASGKFAAVGSKVYIGGDTTVTGTVKAINGDTGKVSVELTDGKLVDVEAKYTQAVGSEPVAPQPVQNFDEGMLDLSGIVAKPRVPQGRGNIQLPGLLPALTQNDVGLMLRDWPAWVASQRAAGTAAEGTAIKAGQPTTAPAAPAKPDVQKTKADFEAKYGVKLAAPNAYNDPMLRDWLDQKYKGKDGKDRYINRGWYNPILRPGETVVEPAEKDGKAVSARRDRAGEQKAAVGQGPNVYYQPSKPPAPDARFTPKS